MSLDLARHVEAGLLRFDAASPSLYGFEMHLTLMHRLVEGFAPDCVVVDPIPAFHEERAEVHAMLLRMVDLLRSRGVTAVFTNLTQPGDSARPADHGVSSLTDSWIWLTDIEANGERNRGLYAIKSRGMSHSNQIHKYAITSGGMRLTEPYLGPEGGLTGSTSEAQKRAAALVRRQIAETRAALEAEEAEVALLTEEADGRGTGPRWRACTGPPDERRAEVGAGKPASKRAAGEGSAGSCLRPSSTSPGRRRGLARPQPT